MSIIDTGPKIGKHCFTYCGDEFCDCELAPRYQDLVWPAQGIEARSDETGTGSAVGESPTPKGVRP